MHTHGVVHVRASAAWARAMSAAISMQIACCQQAIRAQGPRHERGNRRCHQARDARRRDEVDEDERRPVPAGDEPRLEGVPGNPHTAGTQSAYNQPAIRVQSVSGPACDGPRPEDAHQRTLKRDVETEATSPASVDEKSCGVHAMHVRGCTWRHGHGHMATWWTWLHGHGHG